MPRKDTLTISCIFRIYLNNGSLVKDSPYFTLSVVNSKAKWDYDLVQKMIEKKEVKYDDLKFEDGSKPQSEEKLYHHNFSVPNLWYFSLFSSCLANNYSLGENVSI